MDKKQLQKLNDCLINAIDFLDVLSKHYKIDNYHYDVMSEHLQESLKIVNKLQEVSPDKFDFLKYLEGNK